MLSAVRRRIVWILILTLLPASLFAVTEEAKQSLRAKYADAEVQQWRLDSSGNWEVSFLHEGVLYRAQFSDTGEWIYTETTVEDNDIPKAIRDALDSELKDSTVELVEAVDHARHGKLFEVLTNTDGKRRIFQFNETGERVDSILTPRSPQKNFEYLTTQSLIFEFLLNLLIIVIFACGIYYRRHHDHEMLFLLLGFNLFLFPIFLVSNNLSAGMGFTIFALLALVRLRSDALSKTEIGYLLGAVALTFINGQLQLRAELIGSSFVLATAWFADHPRIRKDPRQSIQLRYKVDNPQQMLDRKILRERISDEFDIDVQHINITAVQGTEVRMVVVYKERRGPGKLKGSVVKEG